MGEENIYDATPESFIQFLKDNEIHGKFEDNFNWSDWNNNDTFQEYLEKIDPEDYVGSAFDWDESDDGYDYWETVDYLWDSNIN